MVYQFGYFQDKQTQIEEFKRRALRAHNRYRSWHGAGPLTINETLNRLAQGVAENLKYIDHLVHSNTKLPNGEPLGENLASSTGPLSGRFCTDLWYDEERMHDYSGEYTKPTGHFTQLVWKATTQVGFGVATRGKYTVGVALYYQAGNVIGSFKQNVQPPIRRTTFPPTSNPTVQPHSAPSLQHSHSTMQLPQSQPTFSSSRRRAESLNNLPYGSLSKKTSQSHDNLFDNGYQNNVLSAASGNISGLAHSSSNSLYGSNPSLQHSGSFSFGSSGFLGSAHNLYGSGYFHHPIYPSVINPFVSGALGFAF